MTADGLHEWLARTYRVETWSVDDCVTVRLVDENGVITSSSGTTLLAALVKAAGKVGL